MSIRVLVFADQGDGAAQAGMNQLRAIIAQMKLDATVQIVSDKAMHSGNGVTELPSFTVDGVFMSQGWVPSRNEIIRALTQRQAAIGGPPAPGGPGGPGQPPRRH
jgi:Thioredoxin domain